MAGVNVIRAAFRDSIGARATNEPPADPPGDIPRQIDGQEYGPGHWPGAPHDRLPPGCPVTPLGIEGKTSYFVDSLGQTIAVESSEWGKKTLLQLFALQPNFVTWAWPRWSAPRGNRPSEINGVEVDAAVQCLVKAAALKGVFSPLDRIRGRGGWRDKAGTFYWHAGDRIWTMRGRALQNAGPGTIGDVFYARRPEIAEPWQEPVDTDSSPAHDILDVLRSWNYERKIDPLLILGWIGAAWLGAALDWRPTILVTGDKGVGKSTLQALIKGLFGDALLATSDTTAAGIYQRVRQDSLPVGVDELEGGDRGEKARRVVELARVAASGGVLLRGGQDHSGAEFRANNAFFLSAINPPELGPQDRSRMASINLGRLKPGARRRSLKLAIDVAGRMILRQLMDTWPQIPGTIERWKRDLGAFDFDSRGADTFGTLLALANVLLGDEAMIAAGVPVDEPDQAARVISRATAGERAEQVENWRRCLDHILGSRLEWHHGGMKPTVGAVLEELEAGTLSLDVARERLGTVGLSARLVEKPELGGKGGHVQLAVPVSSSRVAEIMADTDWRGSWSTALKQAPEAIVIRGRQDGTFQRINRSPTRCLLVDMPAFDRLHADAQEGDSF